MLCVYRHDTIQIMPFSVIISVCIFPLLCGKCNNMVITVTSIHNKGNIYHLWCVSDHLYIITIKLHYKECNIFNNYTPDVRFCAPKIASLFAICVNITHGITKELLGPVVKLELAWQLFRRISNTINSFRTQLNVRHITEDIFTLFSCMGFDV